ncbi:MAG: YggS family pyridoxal phosphate-dependent enzyme [Sedimenticola sp.]
MNNPIHERLQQVKERIAEAVAHCSRAKSSIQLLAVSKTRPAEDILEAFATGQLCFGESYLQEALEKIEQLSGKGIEWHFIGRIQSNKSRAIAENFDWVHSVGSIKHAQRLNDQRPAHLAPLNVCLQINIDDEESKAGTSEAEAAELVTKIHKLPRLRLRGLMTLPAPSEGIELQRRPFRALRLMRDRLATSNSPLETLSMGMSSDLEAAIAEGATIVRVGTDIFGPRTPLKNSNHEVEKT